MAYKSRHTRFLVALVIAIVVIASAVAIYEYSLSGNSPNTSTNEQGKTLKVVATFYPLYDFAQNVGGDKVNVSLLVPETVDVHEFDYRPSSIALVASANVLIYNGADLEPWIPRLVSSADNSKLVIVNSSQGIALLPVSTQFQKDNRTVDPHIWLDPVLAKQQVNSILQGLIQADPADQQYFTTNAQNYEAKLDYLNSEILNDTANVKTRMFITFHEAFAYFAQQYNLKQLSITGPFEEEPTPSDIKNIVNAINFYHLKYVGYESLENPAISQSIAADTNATLILMNPIEGLTTSDQAAGKTYLVLMQEDLANILLALNNVGSG